MRGPGIPAKKEKGAGRRPILPPGGGGCMLVGDSLQAVTQQQDEWQALAGLVWAGAGLGGLQRRGTGAVTGCGGSHRRACWAAQWGALVKPGTPAHGLERSPCIEKDQGGSRRSHPRDSRKFLPACPASSAWAHSAASDASWDREP